MQKERIPRSIHYVFIADNDGMSTVFPMVLQWLKEDEHVHDHFSLLYIDETKTYVFKEELDILTKRFSTRFLTCYESPHRQETLEAIINTNTKKQMEFYLALIEEGKEYILSQLRFLGINPHNIHSIIHQSYHNH